MLIPMMYISDYPAYCLLSKYSIHYPLSEPDTSPVASSVGRISVIGTVSSFAAAAAVNPESKPELPVLRASEFFQAWAICKNLKDVGFASRSSSAKISSQSVPVQKLRNNHLLGKVVGAYLEQPGLSLDQHALSCRIWASCPAL
jgi:hypothetical protein